MNARIMNAVRAHQWKSRVLAGIVLALGLISITAGTAIVSAYFVLYRPKEKQLLRDYGIKVRQSSPNTVAEAPPNDGSGQFTLNDLNQAHLTMTYAIGMGTALLAVSVGLLGLGTLVTVTLVILDRRAALRQIKENLAHISNRLRDLQEGARAGPSSTG